MISPSVGAINCVRDNSIDLRLLIQLVINDELRVYSRKLRDFFNDDRFCGKEFPMIKSTFKESERDKHPICHSVITGKRKEKKIILLFLSGRK